MPAKSRAQQRAIFAKKGAAWAKAHGFDKISKKGGKHKKK
jgi:hypothetical protein